MGDHIAVSQSEVRLSSAADQASLLALGFDFPERYRTVVESRGGELTAALALSDQPFESQILSLAVVKIIGFWHPEPHQPDAITFLNRSVELLADQGIQMITYRTPIGATDVGGRLELAGFNVIETLQTYDFRLLESTSDELPNGVEFAQHTDADECAEIAASIFQTDRFHADPEIPNDDADTLKKTWIHNSVSGRADRVLITRSATGDITGFNACTLNAQTAAIDLIGVAMNHQGQGLGHKLVQAAQTYYAGRAKRLTVGTQSTNSRSIALYQSLGFDLVQSAQTLHLHCAQ